MVTALIISVFFNIAFVAIGLYLTLSGDTHWETETEVNERLLRASRRKRGLPPPRSGP